MFTKEAYSRMTTFFLPQLSILKVIYVCLVNILIPLKFTTLSSNIEGCVDMRLPNTGILRLANKGHFDR